MNAEPFSHLLLARDIPAAGKRVRIAADESELKPLAEALGIPAVAALSADLDIQPLASRGYRVRGRLEASVVQTDVVSLDPVAQVVVETIDVTLLPEEGSRSRAPRDEILVDVGEEDGPDLFRNGRIDLGVIVREHLALGLDPYPRAPGTDFVGYVESDPAADPSPFAALAAIRKTGE